MRCRNPVFMLFYRHSTVYWLVLEHRMLLPFKPSLSSSSFFICFMLSFYPLKPYRLCISSLFDGRQSNIFRISLVYMQVSNPPLPFLCFIFSFKTLQNRAFRYFLRMKVERKVIERGRGYFFYSGIKTVAAVLLKSSVYAGFRML